MAVSSPFSLSFGDNDEFTSKNSDNMSLRERKGGFCALLYVWDDGCTFACVLAIVWYIGKKPAVHVQLILEGQSGSLVSKQHFHKQTRKLLGVPGIPSNCKNLIKNLYHLIKTQHGVGAVEKFQNPRRRATDVITIRSHHLEIFLTMTMLQATKIQLRHDIFETTYLKSTCVSCAKYKSHLYHDTV